MSNPVAAAKNTKADSASLKQQPWWAVPVVLSIIMISSGVFVVLLAYGISIFSSIPY